jgi:site-specific DNA-cytosine methylase
MKYISICSGIEAASVAFHGFGWTPLAFSEIEAFPSAVLAHHWPHVPNLGDMTKFAEWPEEILAECDLLVGGPPCQAFSVAGLRKSLDDDRGNITLAYVRLLNHIDEVRKRHGRPPAIAVYENVPGLLSTKDNAFGCLIGALAGCDEAPEPETRKWPKAGYVCGETRRVGYRVIDAQFFGVAQRRRRIFLVAVPCESVERLGERLCPSEILSLRESLLGNPPSRGQSRQGASASTETGAGSSVFPCIDANVDAKWGSDQGVEGGYSILEQPVYLDRAAYNQGQNAQYKPQITQDGVASSMVDRGPAAVMWSASDQAGAERLVESAGTLNCNRGQRGGWVAPLAFKPGQSEAAGGTFTTEEFCPTLQAQNNGSTAVPAVAFKPSHFTRGKDGKPDEVTPPLSADADKGDQDTVVCATGQITHALTTRAACEEDGTGRGNPIIPMNAVGFNWQNGGGYGKANDGLGITEEGTGPLQRCNTPTVAFDTTQVTSPKNYSNPKPGDPCHPLAAGAHVPAVAFKESQSGCRVSDVHATIDANKGSRRQEGVFAFAQNQLGEVRENSEVMGTVNTNQNASGRNTPMVHSAMQVRRLTPKECEYLQGFPADHTNVTFRKKPAADGPRYRALGNSMAVPCMVWLGHRIHQATMGDIS